MSAFVRVLPEEGAHNPSWPSELRIIICLTSVTHVSPSQILTLTEALEESQVTVKVHQEQLEEERRVRAKFIGNYRNLQEFAGICRNLQEFAGICRK